MCVQYNNRPLSNTAVAIAIKPRPTAASIRPVNVDARVCAVVGEEGFAFVYVLAYFRVVGFDAEAIETMTNVATKSHVGAILFTSTT